MVLHAGCSQSTWMDVCGMTDLGASPGQMNVIPKGTAVVGEVIIQTFGAMDGTSFLDTVLVLGI